MQKQSDSKKKYPKSIRDRISPTCHELPKPLLSTYQLWNKKDSVRIFLKKGEELIHQIPENSPTALEFYGTQASLYNWIGEFQKSLDILTNKSLIQTQLPYDKYHILMARNYEGLGNYQKAFHCMTGSMYL